MAGFRHYRTGRELTHPSCAGQLEIICIDTGGFTFSVKPKAKTALCYFCEKGLTIAKIDLHPHPEAFQ